MSTNTYRFTAQWTAFVEFDVEASSEDEAFDVVYGEIPFGDAEMEHIEVDLIKDPSPLEQLAMVQDSASEAP